MRKSITFLAAGIVAMALAVAAPAKADSVSAFDSATGTGPWDLSSTASTDSGVYVQFSTPITFNSLNTLSATFTDNSGGAYGGAPRFVLFTSGSDFFDTYLGTPPNFADSNPAAFTAAFSGTNLDNGTADSDYQNGGSYVSLASLQSLYGSDLITSLIFVVDGGWGANGTQDLTLDSFDVNGKSYNSSLSATPLPTAFWSLLGGLALFGAFLALCNKFNGSRRLAAA